MAVAIDKPMMAERTELCMSCRQLLRSRPRVLLAATPASPGVVHKLHNICERFALGAEARPKSRQSWATGANVLPRTTKQWSKLGQARPELADVGHVGQSMPKFTGWPPLSPKAVPDPGNGLNSLPEIDSNLASGAGIWPPHECRPWRCARKRSFSQGEGARHERPPASLAAARDR